MFEPIRDWLMAPVVAKLESLMADVSPLLTQLAQDLRTYASGPLATLLAEHATLKARNAELEGEDVAESAAAQDAAAAFNELVVPINQTPDIPIEVPVVEVPAP